MAELQVKLPLMSTSPDTPHADAILAKAKGDTWIRPFSCMIASKIHIITDDRIDDTVMATAKISPFLKTQRT